MISRLTASAATFAILVTATLGFAAETATARTSNRLATSVTTSGTTTPDSRALPHFTLPRVEVTGRRTAAR